MKTVPFKRLKVKLKTQVLKTESLKAKAHSQRSNLRFQIMVDPQPSRWKLKLKNQAKEPRLKLKPKLKNQCQGSNSIISTCFKLKA